jgi:DNA-3-methyladenine glycosylase
LKYQEVALESIRNILQASMRDSLVVASSESGKALRVREWTRLPSNFYDRDPRRVARELLGKVLVRREGRKFLAGRIVEVEAYLHDDPAAHSFIGRTDRNFVLWGPPGISYVYFIYGNHYLFNVSCLPDGVAGGVLFRAVEPLIGIREMARGRDLSDIDLSDKRQLRLLTSGPGRLAEAFGITRQRDNEKDLTSAKSDLWIADDGAPRPRVKVTRRIGITKGAERPLRYVMAGNQFVSGTRSTERS